MLTMSPKELKWSKSAYRLHSRRVATVVKHYTRITHQVLWWIQTINQNHLTLTPFINKTLTIEHENKIKHNTKPSQICTSSVDSPSDITKHHLKLKLGFRNPFQVQSQLNTSPVNGNLVLQEAFKPSQVIPELILALCLKCLRLWIKSGTKSIIFFWKYRLMWVPLSCQKPKRAKDGWPLLM